MNNQLINEQVDPMTGEPVQFTTVPSTPSNELGSAKPLFNDGSKNYAQSIHGDVAQKPNGFSGGGVTGAVEAVKAAQGMGAGNPLSGTGGPADSSNPFGGQKFQITPVQMTYETPSPANMQGSADPLFNESATNAGNMMFGDVSQRQRSLQNQAGVIQAPVYFKDQTGDNKITKADVVKARTEGYKE